MKRPPNSSKIDREPVIAKWELWTVAQMLISTHGDAAETHVEAKLAEAQALGDEADEIVWSGVSSQLQRIRNGG
jgi:hypothetical protein